MVFSILLVCAARENLSLQEQYTFWIFYFVSLIKFLKSFPIRVTLCVHKATPLAAHIEKLPSWGVFLYVRPGRIGLPSSDWQPDVLPLNHGRV